MLIIGAEIEPNVSTGIFFHQVLFTLKTKKKASGSGSGQYPIRAVGVANLPLYNLFSRIFNFPIDIFIKIYYNVYSKEKEMTTMKFLFIMCSLMVIAGAVSRFGKAIESKRPNYKQMIQYAVELLAVAIVFANF